MPSMKKNNQICPTVSIICRTYNQERYIRQTIQSVLNQTISNWELIVINDASTDNTESEILSFDDERIKYIRNEKNLGPLAGLNIGIAASSGKYITILDGDDLFCSEKLEIQSKFLDANPKYGAVFSYIDVIDENGNPLNSADAQIIRNLINNPGGTREQMLRRAFNEYNFLAFPTEMFRKDIAIHFNAHLLSCGDGWFHLNTLMQTQIAVLEIPLTKYRIIGHNVNVSGWVSGLTDISEKFFMLDKFLEINSATFFKKIFADDIGDRKFSKSDIPFIMIEIAGASNDPIKKLWANYTFHRLVSNPDTYTDFIKNKKYPEFMQYKLGDVSGRNLRLVPNIDVIRSKHKKYRRLFNWTATALGMCIVVIVILLVRHGL